MTLTEPRISASPVRSPAGRPTPAVRRQRRAQSRRFWVGVAAADVVLAALGAATLGRRSIWYDEAFTAGMVRAPWDEFTTIAWRRELNMILHYLLLRPWGALGDSPEVLRSFSLLCALATVPLVALLGVRLFDRRTGLVAATLLAVHASVVQYAVEARAYTLAMLLVSATAWLLIAGVDRRREWLWVGAGIVGALAVYAHLFAGPAVVAMGASVLWLDRSTVPRRHLLLAVTTFGLGLVPEALFLRQTETSQVDWIGDQPSDAVGRGLQLLSGGSGRLVSAMALLFLAAAFATLRAVAWRGRNRESWRWILLLAWASGPLAAGAAISVAHPILVPRYVLVSVPAFVLVAAGALGRLPHRRLLWGLIAVLLVFEVEATASSVTDGSREDWRGLAAKVATEGRPDDGLIVVPGYQRMPFEYELLEHSDSDALPQPLLPRQPWGEQPLYGGDGPAVSALDLGAERIWVVVGTDAPDDDALVAEVEAALADRVLVEDIPYGDVSVRRYDSVAAGSGDPAGF